jgi:multisubunit Na+/H+ antiporter MnhB subunit
MSYIPQVSPRDSLASAPAAGLNVVPAARPSAWVTRAVLDGARRVFTFPAALASLLALTVFATARQSLSDPDIWWHLRNAEYLLTNLKLPRYDGFSFTVIGRPWINHEWLAEVPYDLAWRAFGLVGIKAVSLILLESIFLGLLYFCWRVSGNIKAATLVCVFAVMLGSVSFGPRTLLFGYDYLLVLLIILERFRSRGKAPLWVLPPLFCLWVNTHGSWSLGMVAFGIVAASGLLEGRWGRLTSTRWSPSQLRNLGITMGASIAALFVNPYGYRLALYPFDLAFHQKLNIAHVAEWVSVDFHDFRGKLALLLIVALLAGALLSKHQWKLYEAGLILFGLYSGLTYIRFLFLVSIFAAPVLAKLLDFIPPYQREIDKPLANAMIMAAVAGFMVGGFPSAASLQKGIDRDYPTEAISYLKAHPPAGPMLNYYLWGGFMEWNNRDIPTFVDSRVDIFEYAGIFQDYINLIGLKEPEAVLDKYRIQYVFFPPGEPLTYVLRHDPQWKEIYTGQVSVIFQRSGGGMTGAPAPAGGGR